MHLLFFIKAHSIADLHTLNAELQMFIIMHHKLKALSFAQ